MLGSTLRHPIDLNIRRHEPAEGSANHNPRVHLTAAFRITVQQVCIERHGGYHDAADLGGEENGKDPVGPDALEGETDDEDGDGHERGGEPDDDEARFGNDGVGVAPEIEGAD